MTGGVWHRIRQDHRDRFDWIRFVRGLGLRIGGQSDVTDQDTEQVRTGTAYRDRGSVQSKLYRVERSAPETSVEVTRATDPISCHACRRAYVNLSIETRSVLDGRPLGFLTQGRTHAYGQCPRGVSVFRHQRLSAARMAHADAGFNPGTLHRRLNFSFSLEHWAPNVGRSISAPLRVHRHIND